MMTIISRISLLGAIVCFTTGLLRPGFWLLASVRSFEVSR